MKTKICSIFVVSLLFVPVMSINFSFGDLRVSEDRLVGKDSFWQKLWSGQIWLNWLYGENKVLTNIWNTDLKVAGLDAGYQQVIIKIDTDKITQLSNDFKDAKIEILYNVSSYSYVTVEMKIEDITQKFWSRVFGGKTTLADKSYVHSISANQRMSLIIPMSADYADKDDVARTTYELCEDYNILDLKYTGEGISIAVLDTGVRTEHLGFTNSTSGWNTTIYNESFVAGEDWKDYNGHGTHCIGIIAGQDTLVNNVPMRGVAPNATIYSLKVLDSKGRGTEDDIIKGIYRAVELNVDIISMSLGGSISYFSALNDAVQYAVGKGIIIVAASGNTAEVVSSQPASWEGVISVGALTEKGNIAQYTCLGANIFAEGTNITSLKHDRPNATLTLSGTSMSTPFVAGVIALLLEANPSLRGRPVKVAEHLKATGAFGPRESKQIKWIGISVVPDNYAYTTRVINPKNLVELTPVSDITRPLITDVRIQLLRNKGI